MAYAHVITPFLFTFALARIDLNSLGKATEKKTQQT